MPGLLERVNELAREADKRRSWGAQSPIIIMIAISGSSSSSSSSIVRLHYAIIADRHLQAAGGCREAGARRRRYMMICNMIMITIIIIIMIMIMIMMMIMFNNNDNIVYSIL